MYGVPVNSNGVNRLPKEAAPAPSSINPTVGRALGTMVVQAAAVVLVAKIVDVAIEAFMNRRRERQQAPQRARREEPAAV